MSVEVPGEALAAAEKRMGVLEPAATLNGLAGLETTPTGKPVNVTWTEPVKPLSGSTERLIGELVAPCSRLTEFWENPMEKSGCGGGGGGGCIEEEPPPQP
jgi:hypothetical protein